MRVDETILEDQRTAKIMPVVSRGKKYNYMELPALMIEMGFGNRPESKMVNVVFGTQSLEYLIDNLWKISISPSDPSNTIDKLSISFSLKRTPFCKGPQLESRVLAPFANVVPCGHVSFRGTTGRLSHYLSWHMERPPADISMVEESAQAYLCRGGEAFGANLIDKACFQYKYALHFMRHIRGLPVSTPQERSSLRGLLFRSGLRLAKTFILLSLCEDASVCLDLIAAFINDAPTYEQILWNMYHAFAMIGEQSSRGAIMTGTVTQADNVSAQACGSHLLAAFELARGNLAVVHEFRDMKRRMVNNGLWGADSDFSTRWEEKFDEKNPLFAQGVDGV